MTSECLTCDCEYDPAQSGAPTPSMFCCALCQRALEEADRREAGRIHATARWAAATAALWALAAGTLGAATLWAGAWLRAPWWALLLAAMTLSAAGMMAGSVSDARTAAEDRERALRAAEECEAEP